jgi:S-adenosylmethionine synthetase
MSAKTYKKKIEAYVKQKDGSASKGNDSKGLLSPKNPMTRGTTAQKDSLATIGEFVYALRQKRREFQQNKTKKESK